MYSKTLKTILAALALSFAAGYPAVAEEYDAKVVDDSIRNGLDNTHQIQYLRVKTAVILPAGAIDAADLATDSVTAAEIAAGAVGASEIATDAVGSAEITNSAVGADEIATDAVGADEIAASAVGASEIAADSVGSSELARLTITASTVVTNGQEVTLAAHQINQLLGGGSASGETNTITLANVALTDAGKPTLIINLAAATNAVAMAVAGNNVGPAFVLLPGESRLIIPVATNVLYNR